MACIFGIDIIRGSIRGKRRPKYALYILDGSKSLKFREISRAKLFRLVKNYSPEIIAVDNTSELFSSKEDMVSFLKKLPDVKLVQIAGKYSLPYLAKRFGLRINIKDPMDEAKACAVLASFGVGEEVSVFSDETRIIVSRNRSLGKGGWSQNRYRRLVHADVMRVYKEVKEILEERGLEYEEYVKSGYGGISRGVLTVKAPRKLVPVTSFKMGNVQVRVEAVEKERIEYIPLSKQTTYTIVGVDPGTTTAVAVLDINGKLLGVRSKKNWNSAEVVEYILSFGKPVIVATDKSNPPEFVSKLRASFNALIHVPKEDTSVERKKYLVSPFKQNISNDHERDALSAAIDAYNAHKNKLISVEKKIPPGVDVDAVKVGVLRGMTLKELIEKKSESQEKIPRQKSKTREIDRRLEKRIKELEEENEFLRKEISELRNEIERLRCKLVSISRKEHEKIRRDNYVKTLEAELLELRKLLKEKDGIIKELNEKVKALRSMKILEFSGWKSVKLLESFTRAEIEKLEREMGICDGDVIYIKSPAGGGKSQAEYLCRKGVKAVITKSDKMAHTALDVFERNNVPVIDEEELDVRVAEYFAIVNSEAFERVYSEKIEKMKGNKLDNLERMILEYRNRFKKSFLE